MSRFDDRLTTELERAATPADPDGAFDEIDRRRSARVAMRRVQAAILATVVFAGSLGGVLVLNRAFRGDGLTAPAVPDVARTNGPIIVSFGDDGGTHLYLQRPDDPHWDPRDHQLTPPVGLHDRQATVAPDGRTVVFVRVDPSNFRTSLWSIGINGGNPREISSGTLFGPAYSPDGSTVAVSGIVGEERRGGIVLMAPDGGDVRSVPNTETDIGLTRVTWSPDGGRLAFGTQEGASSYAVGTIGVDGSGRDDLPGTGSVKPTDPAWSPDGGTIAFVRDHDVWLYDLASQKAVRLTTYPDPDTTEVDAGDQSPTWSPDGRWIAFERSFAPSETFTYAIRPDGSGLHRIGLGADPAWAAAPSEVSPTDAPPTRSPVPVEPTPGRDIGLPFDLCRLRPLRGIDFLGNGTEGTAWVGGRLAANGSCPDEYAGESVVAVDVDGDGLAESWAGPLARCVGCSPFTFTDLNADGTQELVVTMQFSATTEYTVFSLQPAPGVGPPVLEQVTVAEPGAPPILRPDRPLTFWSGGDAGFSAWVRCEGYPQDPVLVLTQTEHPIEGPGSDVTHVNIARLVLRADGTAEVVGSDSYTEPTTYASGAFTGRACGLDLWPAA
jgi:TolB protein